MYTVNKLSCRTKSVAHLILTEHHIPCFISTALVHSSQSRLVSITNHLSQTHKQSKCTYVFVCMYPCPKIYIRRALNKVTDAPRSQTNKNVSNARLKHSVDRSTERQEVGRLFQILDPATAKLWSRNVLLVRRTTNDERRSIRRSTCAPYLLYQHFI